MPQGPKIIDEFELPLGPLKKSVKIPKRFLRSTKQQELQGLQQKVETRSQIKTIGELRRWLDDFEKTWTPVDEKYLGKFEDQGLYTRSFDENGKFDGYDSLTVCYTSLGAVFETPSKGEK